MDLELEPVPATQGKREPKLGVSPVACGRRYAPRLPIMILVVLLYMLGAIGYRLEVRFSSRSVQTLTLTPSAAMKPSPLARHASD